jgi:hypothetical protein
MQLLAYKAHYVTTLAMRYPKTCRAAHEHMISPKMQPFLVKSSQIRQRTRLALNIWGRKWKQKYWTQQHSFLANQETQDKLLGSIVRMIIKYF